MLKLLDETEDAGDAGYVSRHQVSKHRGLDKPDMVTAHACIMALGQIILYDGVRGNPVHLSR